MENICYSSSNIISDLPGVILENILMCMPLRDAVRTSILSKRWRGVWVKIPQLVFDDNLLTIVQRQHNLISRNKLLLTISQVLMLHPAPILKFTLSIFELESCPGIDNLIAFLNSNVVEELTLQIWNGIEYYKLPSSLFSFTKLTHLSLRGCIFRPPTTFEGFSRVVFLELNEVIITKESFARLISSCSLLEKLKLETSETWEPREIDSCSLTMTYFCGDFKSLRFKNAHRLANVSLLVKGPIRRWVEPDYGDSFGWFNFFTNLPVLENLEMDQHYVKSLADSNVSLIANTLGRLKVLKLHDVCIDSPGEIGVALCLMLSPKLEKVTIKVNSTGQHVHGQMYLQSCENTTFVFDQLREVELGITSGTAVELEFIKLLLAKSRVLEKIVLKPDPGMVYDGGLRILMELAEFERLSPKAKVTYKDTVLPQGSYRMFYPSYGLIAIPNY